MLVKTLEGDHTGGFDDWIIRGVKGELYPCKPDIFAATYEAVEERIPHDRITSDDLAKIDAAATGAAAIPGSAATSTVSVAAEDCVPYEPDLPPTHRSYE